MQGLFFLCLYFVLGVVFIAAVFSGRWGRAVGVIAFVALLQLPSYLQRLSFKIQDIDARFELSDGFIYVQNRGPLAFNLRPLQNPYTNRSNYFVLTQLNDGTEISISISAVGRGQSRTHPSDCITRPGPYDLVVRPRDENTGFCSSVGRTADYAWTDTPDQFSRIYCTRDNETFCVLRFVHNTMQISVATWEADLSRWREVRDHAIAVLDQSFTPAPHS